MEVSVESQSSKFNLDLESSVESFHGVLMEEKSNRLPRHTIMHGFYKNVWVQSAEFHHGIVQKHFEIEVC